MKINIKYCKFDISCLFYRDAGILPLVVGVANYNEGQLLNIVNNNPQLVFKVSNFNSLKTYASSMLQAISTSSMFTITLKVFNVFLFCEKSLK